MDDISKSVEKLEATGLAPPLSAAIMETNLLLQTKAPPAFSSSSSSLCRPPIERRPSQHDTAKKTFLIGQSEERVQAMSAIMLYLCTGLQYAQGVATQ